MDFVAITPNGDTAYFADPIHNLVLPLDLTQNPPTFEKPITIAGASAIAISPDGSTAWVVGSGGITPIDTATNTAGTAISVGDINAEGIALAPDGSTAYVTVAGGSVIPVPLPSGPAGQPIDLNGYSFAGGDGVQEIAVAPDGATAYALTELGSGGGASGTYVIPIDLADDTAARRSPSARPRPAGRSR